MSNLRYFMSKFLIQNIPDTEHEESLIKKALKKSFLYGADDETRTRDSLLGRQILYQLSYVRLIYLFYFQSSAQSVECIYIRWFFSAELNFRIRLPAWATELRPLTHINYIKHKLFATFLFLF